MNRPVLVAACLPGGASSSYALVDPLHDVQGADDPDRSASMSERVCIARWHRLPRNGNSMSRTVNFAARFTDYHWFRA